LKKKLIAVVLAVLLLGGAALFYAMPYLVIWSMYQAVKTGDSAALVSHVDFPSLRGSIKSNLDQSVSNTLSKVGMGPLGAIGARVANSLASPIIDAVVTPEGVAKMMSGQKPTAAGMSAPAPAPSSGEDPVVSMGYESFGTFVVYAGRNDTGPLGLVFTRDGLSWKLSAVRFPS